MFVALAVLLVGSATAEAAPYPPTNPSCAASSGNGNGGGGLGLGDSGECRSFAPSSEVRTPDSRTSTSVTPTPDSTASTGFDTLTASLIAAALLLGGGALVFAGRRAGRHS